MGRPWSNSRAKRDQPIGSIRLAGNLFSQGDTSPIAAHRGMNILIKVGFLAIVLGLCALLLFQWLGSAIDEHGYLKEPFALVPVGTSLLMGGILAVAIGLFKRRLRYSSAD